MTSVPEPHPSNVVGVQHPRDGRETLSVAEGILIALRRCSQTEAFDELLRVANRHHLSVLTVAHALVDLAIDAHPTGVSGTARGGIRSGGRVGITSRTLARVFAVTPPDATTSRCCSAEPDGQRQARGHAEKIPAPPTSWSPDRRQH
ncbi:ANTAR domain-containing protein [Rhodococcus sp. NPDC059968]|uniref:ANTAR domain-containing protein n=1 Tax=Rhodococcus sp. NPDC059968 TaxID=3347017 RepID=UPI0036704626